jgi:feruloyl esterase
LTGGGQIATQRPICVYPKLPTYQGGDPIKASSFVCKEAPRGNVPAPAERYLE